MAKKKSTKKALLTSVLALTLSSSMLVGTTFAWFTDSVTSSGNIIQTGTLDVELYYQREGESDWTKVTEKTNVFKEDKTRSFIAFLVQYSVNLPPQYTFLSFNSP